MEIEYTRSLFDKLVMMFPRLSPLASASPTPQSFLALLNVCAIVPEPLSNTLFLHPHQQPGTTDHDATFKMGCFIVPLVWYSLWEPLLFFLRLATIQGRVARFFTFSS